MATHTEFEETSIPMDQITALCRRGFGSRIRIEAIQELGGGTFNTSYMIAFSDHSRVVLRISPRQAEDTYWQEAFLMRREHSMQPFFAPIATWMPRTLLVDFTHQLIDHDYMFQTFIDGERWDDILGELTPAENNLLWAQFGRLTRLIHDVKGEMFGLPLPGFQFASWSNAVIDHIERIVRAAQRLRIELPHLASILELVRAHPQPLDEIGTSHLLHGDLWLFNILIQRGENGPAIVGILDADRAWWGDPMADWTMFILAHAGQEEGHAHFWQAYGQPQDTPGTRYRAHVYDAMHAGTAFIWAVGHHDEETVGKAEGTLRESIDFLHSIL